MQKVRMLHKPGVRAKRGDNMAKVSKDDMICRKAMGQYSIEELVDENARLRDALKNTEQQRDLWIKVNQELQEMMKLMGGGEL